MGKASFSDIQTPLAHKAIRFILKTIIARKSRNIDRYFDKLYSPGCR